MRSSPLASSYNLTDQPSLPEPHAGGSSKLEFGEIPHTYEPNLRWWDPIAALLLLAAIFTAATRLIATEWVDNLSITQLVVVLGVLAGLALGQSRFSPRLVTFFALIYGSFIIPRQFGLALEYISKQTLWTDRLLILIGRLFIATNQLVQREAVEDSLLFLFWMSCLFWALSVHAGYTATRHAHPWRAILPTGVTMLIIHNSDPYVAPRVWGLAVYLGFALLLVSRLTYLRNSIRWKQTRTRTPPLITLDFVQVMLVTTILIVAISWFVPTMVDALPTVKEAWREATSPVLTPVGEWLNKVFASLRRTVVVFTAADYYGDSLSLGRGSQLSDNLVLTVQGPAKSRVRGVRYYWRARVYDNYTDGQWSSVALSNTQTIRPTSPGLTFPELDERRTFTFTFTSASPIATLYAAPQPRWLSLSARVDLAHNPDGTADVSAWRVTPPLDAGMTYQVRSSLSTVTVAQLRAAGTDYPEWITDRYLQIPSTITTRTLELARQIAVDQDNPYDVAAAVTSYLRNTILYTETVPAPPTLVAGEEKVQELLDWFLFDLRQGFCNYYASSQVIMLRSLGIPARLAVGFAEGDYQSNARMYVVRRRDAHAWPEVYFPNLGWIEFEPTASQSPISRPLGLDQAGTELDDFSSFGGGGPLEDPDERLARMLEDNEAFGESGAVDIARDPRDVWISWGTAFLAVAIITIALLRRTRRKRGAPPILVSIEKSIRRVGLRPPKTLRLRARHAASPPLTRAYLELNYALTRLKVPPVPADTPVERATALTDLLPVAEDPAQQLLDEYQSTVYSPSPGSLYPAQQAARAIRRLSWRARIRQLISRYAPGSPSR
ncbi:MAG: transglutaminase domain-containing protein [Chloroflexi bacterium]|nr:transglutaminase domain-containing protein [Chloroflexota bacterium]